MFSTSYSRKIWKTATLPIVDFLSLLLSFVVIYYIRYKWFEDNLFGINFGIKQIPGVTYLQIVFLISFIITITYAFLGLYEVGKRISIWKLIANLSLGVFLVLLMVITFFFFYEYDKQTLPTGVPISRFILGTAGFLALYFVLLGRGFVWALEQFLYVFNIGKINVAVIGDKTNFLSNYVNSRSDITKIYSYSEINDQNVVELENLIKMGKLSEIYLFSKQSDLETKLAFLAELYKVSFILSPEGFSKYQAFDIKAININKKMFLELKHSNLDGWQVVLKRLFDTVFALLFLIVFSWLYLIVAIAIKLDSKGPVFYLNERIGPDGRVFKLWKFRRFKSEFSVSESNPAVKDALEYEKTLLAEKNSRGGILYKIIDDPRSTKVGKFIEKYSLDELPQFINVLIGNLSVVGPRPHQPREVAKYENRHYKVLNIKPGITGLAQINGRSDLSFEQEVEFDTYYIEHWSFWMDLIIIIKTPFSIIFKRHKG